MRRTVRRSFKKRPVCCSLSFTWTTVDPPLSQTLFDRNVCSVVVSWKELLSNSGGSPAWSSRTTWRSHVKVCYSKAEAGTLAFKSFSGLLIAISALSFQPFLSNSSKCWDTKWIQWETDSKAQIKDWGPTWHFKILYHLVLPTTSPSFTQHNIFLLLGT